MEENKFKPLEDWIEQAKKFGCDDYIAMAVNKNDQMCSIGNSQTESLLKMLMTVAIQNKAFREAIMATATFISKTTMQGSKRRQMPN